ncbi:hypothetical protein M3Y94_01220700 [Aphelenchoides besseyi]|nr:hypothetical protein M3Y94_01220700 [Aphelenchoides besseyi]
MSKPKCFEEQLAIDVRFDPSTQHSELIGGRKSKRTFKGFLTKYFLEGATSEGGGAVAFPVMTLLLNLDPTAARDFSLMIQSCVRELFFSVILSLQFGDNVLTSSEKKMMYSHWIDGLRSGHHFVLHSNTCVFDLRKTATPTSVVLMWINSWVGFFWRHLIMSEISELAFQYWSISVPVVVTCSPAGAFVASHLHRQTLAFMVYILETLSLIGFLLTRPKFTLLLVGCAIVVAHIFIFFALSKLGKLINDGLTVEKKQESPRTNQIITETSTPEDEVPHQLPYANGIYDPEQATDYIHERFRESLQFENYTEQQIRSMIVGMQVLNGWSSAYNVIERMIHMERRMTTRYVAYKIVNIYALQFDRHQRFKQKNTNYQSHFMNQRLLFLMNDPNELANNLMNGMTSSATGTGMRFRYPVDEFQLNHFRIQTLEYTNYYVKNTQQVRICYLVELEWCDKNKISWFDENM